ncbi:MAG: CDP-alcohol phosphatidyltransferase family protein [Bacilli bacterium]|nr:CDP-alcohol phosphatidyltransferase family protein [Bacilli bacterium]
MKFKIKKVIPNFITTIRLIMAIIFPFLFLNGYILSSLIIFFIAATSDYLDGYLARHWEVESKYGRIVDPIADKLLMGLALILLTFVSNKLMLFLLIGEIIIALISIINYINNKNKMKVSFIGKVKTFPLAASIILCLGENIMPSLLYPLIFFIGITITLQTITVMSYSEKVNNFLISFKKKIFGDGKDKNSLLYKLHQLQKRLENVAEDSEKKSRINNKKKPS